MSRPVRIAVVAPANALTRESAAKVTALAAAEFAGEADIAFHEQCFLSSGHFAGTDAERSAAFLEAANDPGVDAVWFARGGYGSCRLDDGLFEKLNGAARGKVYLGYSDLGALLGRLFKEGVGRPAHGPMPSDINRKGGDDAVRRALSFLARGDRAGMEPKARTGVPCAAFNIVTLSSILGTPNEPDLRGCVVMLEEISEHLYRIDRAMFHIMSSENVRRAAGIMLGRVSDVIPNIPDFGRTEEDVFRYWCDRADVPYLGRADIGHDANNKIVPFGGINGPTS